MTDTPLQATITLRGVLSRRDHDVLVLRRASDGGWELPGGRLDESESPVDAVRREIAEETGLEPTVVEPVHTFAWRNDQDAGRFAVYFECRCEDDGVELSAEHTDFRWRTPVAAIRLLSDAQGRAVRRGIQATPTDPADDD